MKINSEYENDDLREKSSEKRKFYSKTLDEILSQLRSQEVYGLTNWLNSLGLKLTVTVAGNDRE